jgi:hypothetical protein
LGLRGRYGRGPLKMNLSKSGASLSLSGERGAFNLTHPLRSSFKAGGIQVRGRNAVAFHLIAALLTLAGALLVLLWLAVKFLAKTLLVFGELAREALARPSAAEADSTGTTAGKLLPPPEPAQAPQPPHPSQPPQPSQPSGADEPQAGPRDFEGRSG